MHGGTEAPDLLRVVQCNILHGGWPYELRGTRLFVQRDGREEPAEPDFAPRPYPADAPYRGDPGSEFARLMHELEPDAIGMQEVDARDVDRLRDLLGAEWRNTPPLTGSGACCIFWNSNTLSVEEPERITVVQNYVNPQGRGIPIRVLKQVLVHAASGKRFALVTGKSWYQGTSHDRAVRAANTRNFARAERLTTVLAIDMSPPGTPAFAAMAPFVERGSQPTCPAGIFAGRQGAKPARTDHLFYWSPRLRGPQARGIVRCEPGPFFGSDHLYVWADVQLP